MLRKSDDKLGLAALAGAAEQMKSAAASAAEPDLNA
jgi:hypothetical protein